MDDVDARESGGWRLACGAALAVCLMTAALLAACGAGEAGLRAVIRNTARTSFALFLPAFAAPALDALRPARRTRRLLARAPYLYAALAASHLVHGAAIFTLAHQTGGASLADRSLAVVAAGGLVYLFILLAAATAYAPAARWIARRAWARGVLSLGLYAVALTFLDSYGGRVLEGKLFYLPFAALALAAPILRLLAALAARRKSRAPAPAAADARPA